MLKYKNPVYGVATLALITSLVGCNPGAEGDIEYRYGTVSRGELVRSITSTGQLIALTSVDIRSKAGGRVDQILVEEGDNVTKGQLLARIDPSDTRTTVEQAQADVQSAQARADAAKINYSLEIKNRRNAVEDAKNAVKIAQVRYDRAETTAATQPELTSSSLRQARAELATQEQAQIQLNTVEIPQLRADARGGLARAKADLDSAKAEYERQQELFRQDYVSKSAVDRAQAALASAQSAFDSANQKLATVEKDIDVRIRQQKARLEQAQASVRSSVANQSRDTNVGRDLAEARANLTQAKLNLQQAQDDLLNIQARAADSRSAAASTVRSRVTLENAQVQLASTTVLSPREGVVTKKYLEAGTIIPPGTSTFSEGTAILQISDTTRMFVECAVDEADIASVKTGQDVRITVEAFPRTQLNGKVTRINPSAETTNNITAIRVRVEIEQDSKVAAKPGMNATCEFLTLNRPNVLIVPAQAVSREGDKTFVKIKGPDGKPKQIEVKLGQSGNEGFEVLSGLKEGQEVVVAEINRAEMREIQQRMQEAQQGGGLTGGNRPPGGAARPTTTGGGRSGGR
ncbi:MAG: efflux RND transporter periplasmic adaptor subunit [Chthonomonas sp.]|nr:efflux RND transporter periplasmic adaptor subunit [Chthonomonas sp.]